MNSSILYNFTIFIVALLISTLVAIFIMRMLKLNENALGKITAFATGNTLVLTIKELYVDTVQRCGYKVGTLYIIMGILIIVLINYILHIINKGNKSFNSLILILIAMVVHKIPEGIIIGIELHLVSRQGLIIILILLLHSILDVMTMAAPMIKNKFNNRRMAKYIVIITFSALIGVVLGLVITTEYVLGVGIGISCGIMFYISVVEMPRETLELIGKKDAFIYGVIGVVIGLIII